MDLTTAVWRTSSYTNANSNHCVEVTDSPGASAVRDTKHRGLGALLFDSPEWRAFIDAAKRDTF
ncbi:DUF397 domain-containing protein [Nocardiopsis baichengensis]|uniref:DUF397 domain-containing protein n=1 Tax=Nocardiopsis baichengensis TaxID=280240 RepID=UPI00034D1299|nr:DUF397 domain-containing protein [Nocardiopsis baichengensis]